MSIYNQYLVLPHEAGQDERGGNLIGKFLKAMTMLPGKNNAHN